MRDFSLYPHDRALVVMRSRRNEKPVPLSKLEVLRRARGSQCSYERDRPALAHSPCIESLQLGLIESRLWEGSTGERDQITHAVSGNQVVATWVRYSAKDLDPPSRHGHEDHVRLENQRVTRKIPRGAVANEIHTERVGAATNDDPALGPPGADAARGLDGLGRTHRGRQGHGPRAPDLPQHGQAELPRTIQREHEPFSPNV